MDNQRFVVSVRRNSRTSVPQDWLNTITSLSGVKLIGSSDFSAVIESNQNKVDDIMNQLGEWILVEPERLSFNN